MEEVKDYEKVIHREGVKVTMCMNRFEVMCQPHAEVAEQQVWTLFKEWVNWRRKNDEV
jgi:hypothetical protein